MAVQVAQMKLIQIIKRFSLIQRFVLNVSIFVLPISNIYAQPENWNVRYYTTGDGLSSNNINCIIKDSRGLIWVGADNGLNRFDGYTFTQLEYAPGNKHALSKIKVLSIYEDEDGLLWIGTSDGLFRFNPSEPLDQIRQFLYRDPTSERSMPQPQPVNRICEDKNGLLWMHCADADEGIYPGLVTFNKQSEIFTEKKINGTIRNEAGTFISENIVPDIFCDSEGTLWASTYSGLHKYDYKTDSFQSYVPDPQNPRSFKNFILYLFEDSHRNFRATGVFGLYPFDRNTEQFEDPIVLYKEGGMLNEESVTFALQDDRNGHIWMRVNQSLIRAKTEPGIDDRLAIEEEWIPDPSNVSTINQMTALLVENPWSIWLPVSDKGLCHIRLQRNNFRIIKPSALPDNSNSEANYITALYADTLNNLWFSTIDPGAVRYNMVSGDVDSYTMLPFNYNNGINRDVYGNLWFASRYGIYTKTMTEREGKVDFTSYFPDSGMSGSLTPRREIEARGIGKVSQYLYEHLIFNDKEGRMWFNSGKGIHDRYDPNEDGFIHLDHRMIDHYNNDTCLAEKEGEIWFPSKRGLLRVVPPFTELTPNTLVPEHTLLYTSVSGKNSSLNTDWIKTLLISKCYEPGTIWVATIGGGLNRLVKTQMGDDDCIEVSFEHFTESDGLCDNNVLGILEDRSGNLWLSTLNGLSKFDPRTGSFINFYEIDGLPASQFTWTEPCTGANGEMIFPNSEGIVLFDPDSLQGNFEIPPVMITGFRIFNEPVIPGAGSPIEKDISFVKEVVLEHNQNFISFEFAALNYEAPEQNQYMYMLEGMDKDWIHAGTRRFAEYTDLPPGSYSFRVAGSNNNGIWNAEGQTLHIVIQRPPWFSWWAFTIYGLILIGLSFLFRSLLLNRARTRRALEIERIEKDKILEVDRMKSRFFTNVSHEFRTPLSLITAPVESALKTRAKTIRMDREEIEMVNRNAKRLQTLIDQLLDVSKLEFGKDRLMVEEGSLEEFLRSIFSNFLSLAESKHIQYNFDAQGIRKATWFDRDKVEKILVNLVNNAFKFTPSGGSIRISLNYETYADSDDLKNAIISVSDTGVGIPTNKLDKIFDRFYQVDNSDTRNGEGTGIGLALAKEVVELYRGTISVESKVNRGTKFTVKLPVAKELFKDEELVSGTEKGNASGSVVPKMAGDASVEDKELSKREPSAKMTGPLILIIEDNLDLRTYISSRLAKEYQVLSAENGRMGLDLAMENIPDLVISDLMMPEMDGIDVCKRIRESEKTSHIPMILLTAKADRESKLEGLETGADEYMIKPFDVEELRIRVKNLIEQRKRLREQFKRQFISTPGSQVSLSSNDALLQKILSIIEQHLPDTDFTMASMARELNISRSHLFRKVSAVTGYTPNDLMRIMRMKKAAMLFDSGETNVSRVMYEVGYNNPSYFSSCFREVYQMNPSRYIRQNH